MNNLLSATHTFDSTDLLQSLISKRRQIQQMADFYQQELNKLDTAYKILSGSERIVDSPSDEVKRVKWTNEALQCLSDKNELLKTVDILQIIFQENPDEINFQQKRRVYITGLSVALNKLIQNHKICKIEIPGEKGYYYGLAEWFNEDKRTIKEEHYQKLTAKLQYKL